MNESNKQCFSCISLFRKCSFVDAQEDQPGRVYTLHTVTEDASVERGTLTGIRPTYTAGATLEQIKQEMGLRGRAPGDPPSAHSSGRFSKQVVRTLKGWLDEHADHPYPTNEQKEALRDQTGLNRVQISNWLANARRRGKVRPKRNPSPTPVSVSEPIRVPHAPAGYIPADQHLTPLERWKESPPESEAPLAAIARAAACTEFTEHDSTNSSAAHSMIDHRLSSGSEQSIFRVQSSTSLDTGESSESHGSFGSFSSSRGSYSSFARKDRRRKRRSTPLSNQRPHVRRVDSGRAKSEPRRPFECTFCVDIFKTKYDWLRHEKSCHLNLEKWICCPNGPIEPCRSGHTTVCAYCRAPEPSAEHIESHDHSTCVEKGLNGRTFTRKDHLRQHLRLVHHVKMADAMDAWKSAPQVVRSRCGFCDATFESWDERAAHLARHFHEGKTMADWTGGWGFDPDVAACVADAMPPFLIDLERMKPLPWSVENGDTNLYDILQQEHASGMQGARGRGWEIMGNILSEYVAQCRQRGEEITDQKLQDYARRCVYGSDDPWNQTRADDPQWLALFKTRLGLNSNSDCDRGGAGLPAVVQPNSVPLLGADLGLRSSQCLGTSSSPLATNDVDAIALGQAWTDILASSVPPVLPVSTASEPNLLQVSEADMNIDSLMDEMMWTMDDDSFVRPHE